jgi:hypothetical protein
MWSAGKPRRRAFRPRIERVQRVLSGLILVLGLAMIVSTLARGGGLVLGTVLGAAFVIIGAGRLWIARATGA